MPAGLGRPTAGRLLQAGQSASAVLPGPVARRVAEAAAVAASRRFGLPPVDPRRLLRPLPGPGDGAPAGWPERRAMVARHLCRVLGHDPGRVRRGRMVDEAVASYARYWAESLRIPTLSGAELAAGITYDGYDHIADGRRAGRGTILVLPHLGGWEWAGAHLASIGHPVSVVVERLEPPELFDWFARFRQQIGMHVIPAGPGAAAACAQALAANHLLCLLSDRLLAGAAGVEVDFFGERTALPAGPATLALRSGARLLPAAVYFRPRTGRHLGLVLPPLDTERRGRLRDDVGRLTQDMAAAFEHLIAKAPTQWHLMQPNWPSDRAAPPPSPDGNGAGPAVRHAGG